ncbi:T9SS type A sorting domain-containing protein [Maribacter chungangensis]|uniref:T9SS type A sorting domain-containing protein n=1 Tax=Maribacter chungangensis TaxID=1069117 RepID=A0ABW3B480_9FLAO
MKKLYACCLFFLMCVFLSAHEGLTDGENHKKSEATKDVFFDVTSDSLALLALYNATNGPNWKDAWDLNENMTAWHGVSINFQGRVSGVNLYQQGLEGELPTEIGNLTSLTTLNLLDNNISGNIPVEIGNLTNLLTLNLGDNSISGSIPIQIGNLMELRQLILNSNNLTGGIPVEIGDLDKLEFLHLGRNGLSGTIPTAIYGLINLDYLYLGNNDLTGNISPEIGNLINVLHLTLEDNNFSGNLPASLGNLSLLNRLIIRNNSFNGSLDFLLNTGLNNNGILLIEGNTYVFEDLEGLIAPFSSISFSYRNQSKVGTPDTIILNNGDTHTVSVTATTNVNNQYQWFKNGTFITGANDASYTINFEGEAQVGEYSCRITNTVVTALTLFTEPILVSTQTLDADLDGVSDSLDQCPDTPDGETVNQNGCAESQLDDDNDGVNNLLDLCPNTAPGVSVDDDGCSDTQLMTPDRAALLAIYNATNGDNWINIWDLNRYIGTWHGVTLDNEGRVFQLDLSENGLQGTLPSELGNLDNLKYLYLDKNLLTGTIPSQIGNLTALNGLFLGNNELSGVIPPEIGNLNQLQYLTLRKNSLEGNIPPEIGNLDNIISISLEDNLLSGNIPESFSGLSEMEYLYLNDNQLTGNIPEALANLDKLKSISLQYNMLYGTIPNLPTLLNNVGYLNILENNFVFEDLETILNNLSDADRLIYGSQSKIGMADTVNVNIGDSYTLSVDATNSENNSYSWRKNGGFIPGANEPTYTIEVNNEGAFGEYDCLITNSIANELTLFKNPITIAKAAKLSQDDIVVKAISASCKDTNNGKISVFIDNGEYDYHITVLGDDYSNTLENVVAGNEILIPELAVGSYEVCVSLSINPELKQCFTVQITEPLEFLTGKTVLDTNANKAQLVVSGSRQYDVMVNNKRYHYVRENTGFTRLTIPLEKGVNYIYAITDKACQGEFKDTIVLHTPMSYPNPTSGPITITGLVVSEPAQLILNTMAGTTVMRKSEQIEQGTLAMDISKLPNGLYLANIVSDSQTTKLKIIKN